MNRKRIGALLLVATLICGAGAQQSTSVRSGSEPGSGQSLGGTSAQERDEEFDKVVVTGSRKSQHDSTTLSKDFTGAALTAAFQMQSTERRIEQSIKRGFPLGEFWIQNDLEQVDDALQLAALNVRNDADLQALKRLQSEQNQLRLWTDWLIQANRNLQLADYYISSSKLDNDEQFQNAVACTRSLVNMLTSRKLGEDRTCQ